MVNHTRKTIYHHRHHHHHHHHHWLSGQFWIACYLNLAISASLGDNTEQSNAVGIALRKIP